MIKVMVFGVFDSFHDGHRFFLQGAKKLGDYLIAVITSDNIVQEIKGKSPKENLEKRINSVRNENLADEVVVGDSVLGSWEIFENYRPDIIALGYDQIDLKENLEKYFLNHNWEPEIKSILPFKK